MLPTKATSLISQTAKELDLSEELVKDVVDFYYSTVIKKVERLQFPTLLIHGLGTIRMSRVKLKNKIEFLKKVLTSNNQDDFKKVLKYNLTKDSLVQFENALENCNNYYQPLYEKRNKNLESQRADSGRDQE
jgi:hypothetical protein